MNLETFWALAATTLGFPAGWLAWQVCRRWTGDGPVPEAWRIGLGLAALFLWGALAGPEGWLLAATLLLGWTLATLSLIDMATFRLPNLLTYPLILAGLILSGLLPSPDPIGHLVGAAAGYGALALVALVYRRVRGREGLGLGDAKLVAAGGAWLGWQALPTVLLAACACAILWIGFQRVRRRSVDLRQPIAFGPALCAGIWLVWLFGPLQPVTV